MMLTIDDVDVDYDVDVDVDYDVDVHYDIDVNYDVDVDYDDLVDDVPDALPPSLPLRESVCHPRNRLRAFQPLLQPDISSFDYCPKNIMIMTAMIMIIIMKMMITDLVPPSYRHWTPSKRSNPAFV